MVLQETVFTAYSFTDDELVVASVFTDAQYALLLTDRSLVAAKKLALPFDPANPQTFTLEHEYLRGQLEALSYILERHEGCLLSTANLLRQMADSQQTS